MEKLDILRSAGKLPVFENGVNLAAANLMKGIVNVITEQPQSFSSETSGMMIPVIGKVMEFVEVKSDVRKTWNSVHRLLSTAVSARQSLAAYIGTSTDSPGRVKADADATKLRGLVGIKKALDSQEKPVPVSLKADSKLTELKDEIMFLVAVDKVERYTQAKTDVELHWSSIIDDSDEKKRTMEQSHGGTYDGTHWHESLTDAKTFAQLKKVASKTILTMDPPKFKKAGKHLKDLMEKAVATREAFEADPDAPWEEMFVKRVAGAMTTAREATLVGCMVAHKGNKNMLQSKCKSEKHAAKNTKNPNEWEGIHELVKQLTEQAIGLMPLE